MANIDYSFENSIPIGPLKIAALDSCKDFAKKVDDYIVSFRQHDAEALLSVSRCWISVDMTVSPICLIFPVHVLALVKQSVY